MCDLDKILRVCKKCGVEKPLTLFVTLKGLKHNKRNICKECNNAYQRKRHHNGVDPGPRVNDPNATTKVCTYCSLEKPFKDFYKSKLGKYRRNSYCIVCCELIRRTKENGGVDPGIKRKKAVYDINGNRRCPICLVFKPLDEYYFRKDGYYSPRCKLCSCKVQKEYEKTRPFDARRVYNYRYRMRNQVSLSKANANWREENKDRHRYNARTWGKNNRSRINARTRYRRKNDPNFKFKEILSNWPRRIFKDVGFEDIREYLGCSLKTARAFIESQFYPHPKTGELMTWENHGKNQGHWNIDHIVPLSSFDIKTEDDFKKAAKIAGHISNLQPLWFEDNMAKGTKVPEDPPGREILFELKSSDES